MAYQVAVCGPAVATDADLAHARRVGELLAERGATVLCGGGGGVMAAVAAGARSRSGLVVGVRPDDGSAPGPAAEVSVTIRSNLGQARNAVLVWSADAVIAVGGSWGTLSEVALAMRHGGIPVVLLGGWRVVDAQGAPVDGPVPVTTAEDAVRAALSG
ncbi:dethiobiotin synthetase [Micromonospora sp. WMMD812]|uniref:SLOG cluster 4 domain-containing protein n=1 Tax=Micromonospora sp. WMMD812 TaxID=3015152 RepID=UPI00248CFA02|nr:dethiobiotin synthetase [Micromonospora sp. WMMD812]WBB68223.1 dethiobiotin synthetase [Micromonospora sp. WMMD812]